MISVIAPIIQGILSAVLPWLFSGEKKVTVSRSAGGGLPGLDRVTRAGLLAVLLCAALAGCTVTPEHDLRDALTGNRAQIMTEEHYGDGTIRPAQPRYKCDGGEVEK